ncbi:MAG: AraC family transcriptional regulator [Rubrivivax sp.]|nr:AraC family transcriptional regulator [Rubrivivax sp.]
MRQVLVRSFAVWLLLVMGSAAVLAQQGAASPAAVARPVATPVTTPVAPAATVAPAAPGAPVPVAAVAAAASAAEPAPATTALDTRVQALKAEVIRLNRDLLVLEEELLFPAGTQVAVFVSMDVGKLFELESVQIKLGDKVISQHLYTPLEVQALHRGGVQRVFIGNLRAGSHAIDAFFTGRGPHERDYKRGTTLKFDKGTEPRYIELRIKDSQGKLQPEFEVKVW